MPSAPHQTFPAGATALSTTQQPPTPTTHRATWWDQLAIVLLGLAGCALSYDALRQMATAVHVRDHLTYLFPLTIDGFIAYGVRALLVLRSAPLHSRLYAWTLFGAATCASIWANGLHALDLNRPGVFQLHLGNATVTVLSAIAPLALAGATHLHILIGRYGGSTGVPSGQSPEPVTGTPLALLVDGPEAVLLAERQQLLPSATEPLTGTQPPETNPSGNGPEPQPELDGNDAGQKTNSGSGRVGRPPSASLDELEKLIRSAHPDLSQVTRASARKAIADQGLSVSGERLTETLARLRSTAEAIPDTNLD